MDRETAKNEVRSRYAEYLRPAKKRVNGQPSYVCPLCGNGTGADGDGMVINPHAKNMHTLKCFKCGFTGDIFDLYQQEHSCDTSAAFSALYDFFGLEVENRRATSDADERTATRQGDFPTVAENATEAKTEATEEKPNFSSYYKTCRALITDTAAGAYISARGIGQETAKRYYLGYDPQSKRIVVPCSNSFYVARSIDDGAQLRYQNPKGASIDFFNAAALYNPTGRPVFITEGAMDALSIIEAGGEAVALNSASNARKLLETLRKSQPTGTLILCLDNDDAGRKARDEIAQGLRELDIAYKIINICGEYKDPNEALTSDRDTFLKAVADTENKIRFPGLLTAQRAIEILENTDDNFINMPSFPKLSKTAKIKNHDTVVIAADTGAGKSSLALNILHDLQADYPAMYINLEMEEATVLRRLVAIHTGIELDQIEGYKHDPSTREKVDTALKEITARREIQLLNDVYNLDDIEIQIQEATRHRSEPTIVFIDTGLLVKLAGKTNSRYERFTQISEELRRISRLNNIIMFVLLQQNREGKKEEKKEPTNSSLKESGSWENDATKIIFLWKNPQTKSKELIITKNRDGEECSIELGYYPHTQTYVEAQNSYANYWDDAPTI